MFKYYNAKTLKYGMPGLSVNQHGQFIQHLSRSATSSEKTKKQILPHCNKIQTENQHVKTVIFIIFFSFFFKVYLKKIISICSC